MRKTMGSTTPSDIIYVTFMAWWRALDTALCAKGEDDALYGEARDWHNSLVVKRLSEKTVNRIINSRKPI